MAEKDVTFFEGAVVWLRKVGIEVEDHELYGVVNKAVQGNVPRFLNRILGLRIVQQHVLFDYFHSVLEHHVKEAKRDGTYEDGIRSLTGASCSVSVMRALALPEKTGLQSGEVEAVKVTIDQSLPFEEIMDTYDYVMKECKRRTELAKRMQEERLAAGSTNNRRLYTPPMNKTGFCKAPYYNGATHVYLVVDLPGRVSSGFYTTKNGGPVTMWTPSRGRQEIQRSGFVRRNFTPIQIEEAEYLWNKQMVEDKTDKISFAIRGPRLLMAWPYFETTYNALFVPHRAVAKKKDKTVRSPVVHVKAVDPEEEARKKEQKRKAEERRLARLDPMHEVFVRSGVVADDDDDDDEREAGEAGQDGEAAKDADKEPFIALMVPNFQRTLNEADAKHLFDALEKGTFLRSRDDLGIEALKGRRGKGRKGRLS